VRSGREAAERARAKGVIGCSVEQVDKRFGIDDTGRDGTD